MNIDKPPSLLITHDEPTSPCDPLSFNSQITFSDSSVSRLPHSTRLLSVDEVMSLMSNSTKKDDKSNSFDVSCRMHRLASADCDPNYSSQGGLLDEYSDVTSDGTLSRCTSTDRISLADGQVEDRFRVDRRKLEAMILGCPSDPCDFEIMRLPIGSDGRILSADDFFAKVMANTSTEIRYPRLLKVGARNRKDPHVRVVGAPENVTMAAFLVRAQLEPHNKITMKMDVSWTHHSHIIGKAGNTIQPVVRRTGVSIHFPDGNKNSEVRKSNQVSINSRGEELGGLEEARASIRQLTPLIFTFTLSANAKYISIQDPNLLVQHVQGLYNVQVELSVTSGTSPLLQGSVRGSETDVSRVKEATFTLLQNLCGPIANHLTVQMKIEVSPQHHAFILGRNNEALKRIMQTTATQISFPDSTDTGLAPLEKSTVVISGAIDNVYAARQNIVGALPLVLMFEIGSDGVSVEDIAQVMQSFNLNIIPKPVRPDGRRPIIIKGAERDAAHIYEAWKLVTQSDKKLPSVMIPPSYHIGPAGSAAGAPPTSSWGAAHPRTSSTSLSPHPLGQNLPSPLTPAFAPPTPAYPPATPTFPGASPLIGGLSPLWPSSAPPHTPSVTTSFPFPAPSPLLYDNNGHNSFFNSTSMANIAAIAAASNTSGNSSPTFPHNTNNRFFGGSNTNIPSSLLLPPPPSSHHSYNTNLLPSNRLHPTITTNFSSNTLLNNESVPPAGLYSALNSAAAAVAAVSNNSNYNNSSPMQHYQHHQHYQQQQQLMETPQHNRQQLEALKALCRRSSPAETVLSSMGAATTNNSSSCSSGVSSPGMSGHDSSGRESSPDMVVLGHIHSPPTITRQHQVPDGSPELAHPDAAAQGMDDYQPEEQDQEGKNRDLTMLLTTFGDWRAPGVEKGLQLAIKKFQLSDYEAKQILANKAMREPVGGTVRTPTSSWSGLGFSKSSPSYQMRQQFQNAGLLKRTVDTTPVTAAADTQQWAEPGDVEATNDSTNTSTGVWSGAVPAPPRPSEDDWRDTKWSTQDCSSPAPSAGRNSGVDSGLAVSITSSNQTSLSDPESSDGGLAASGSSGCSYSSTSGPAHPPVNKSGAFLSRLSSSSFGECVANTRRLLEPPLTHHQQLDLPALLESLKLSQYIDLFQAQAVDLPMLLSLGQEELKELGITAFGHRRKLAMAIQNLTNKLPERSVERGPSIQQEAEDEEADKAVTWNC